MCVVSGFEQMKLRNWNEMDDDLCAFIKKYVVLCCVGAFCARKKKRNYTNMYVFAFFVKSEMEHSISFGTAYVLLIYRS